MNYSNSTGLQMHLATWLSFYTSCSQVGCRINVATEEALLVGFIHIVVTGIL